MLVLRPCSVIISAITFKNEGWSDILISCLTARKNYAFHVLARWKDYRWSGQDKVNTNPAFASDAERFSEIILPSHTEGESACVSTSMTGLNSDLQREVWLLKRMLYGFVLWSPQHHQFPPTPTYVKHMLCITGKAGAKSSRAHNGAIHCVCSHVTDPD